jgi:hypothetical protein
MLLGDHATRRSETRSGAEMPIVQERAKITAGAAAIVIIGLLFVIALALFWTPPGKAEAEAGSIALLGATRQNIAFLNAMLRATLTTRSNDKCPHLCDLKLFLTQ